MMQYRFEEVTATSAAGAALNIPAGVLTVERRSLSFRLQLGGREVDLTLAEFERLERAGRVQAVAELPRAA